MSFFKRFIAGLFNSYIPLTFNETVVDEKGKTQKIQYTNYFVLDYHDDESDVLCRTFITFGDERLPPAEKIDYRQNAKHMFKNSEHVYAVIETYFYNLSKSRVTIQLLSPNWKEAMDESPFKTDNYQIIVEPQSQAITPPIISMSFYLKKEFNMEFHLTINNKEHVIRGIAKRLTKDDLQQMLNTTK
jgi:hypothetical protein